MTARRGRAGAVAQRSAGPQPALRSEFTRVGVRMTSTRRAIRITRLSTGLTLAATLIAASAAARDDRRAIFRPFRDTTGALQSATADPSLGGSSPFFDAGLGTNGQACSTCHEPGQGFTITLPFIRNAFETSSGL